MPLEDLERASHLLVEALELRERYMEMSHQSFPITTGRLLEKTNKHLNSFLPVEYEDKKTIAGK